MEVGGLMASVLSLWGPLNPTTSQEDSQGPRRKQLVDFVPPTRPHPSPPTTFSSFPLLPRPLLLESCIFCCRFLYRCIDVSDLLAIYSRGVTTRHHSTPAPPPHCIRHPAHPLTPSGLVCPLCSCSLLTKYENSQVFLCNV